MTQTVRTPPVLNDEELRRLDAYWRAANYLSVGQIYLLDNPLLREPLLAEHVKPRLLGHFGTTPGLNLLYAHLNRAIVARDLDAIYITGPGHGGPGLVANAYLEGTYSEVYPSIGRDADGLRALFRQFSFPGGIPSHAAPETPGSIHEGGELGYALAHAFGAAFDNPELLVACVVGDGEAETGPLAASWHGTKFLDPVNDGAVLPVLHLNGYKIANPTVLARIPEEELVSLLRGYGWEPLVVAGDEPRVVHQALAAALDRALDRIAEIHRAARTHGRGERPRWPMLVLRTPKGWTGPKVVDGVPVEDTWRAHQVPVMGARQDPEHRRMLEEWMRSYRPEELFDEEGRVVEELAALPPTGDRRMSANPHANGGLLLRAARPAGLPRLRGARRAAGRDLERGDPRARRLPARRHRGERDELPPLRPRRDGLQPPGRRLRRDDAGVAGRGAPHRRGSRPGRARDGGPLRAPLPGLARGLPPDRPPRRVQLLRGVHPHRRLDVQPAREVAEGHAPPGVAAARSRRSTTCSAPTSGARTTTGSRTRTRGSSTTS